jgi:hypothetical protein
MLIVFSFAHFSLRSILLFQSMGKCCKNLSKESVCMCLCGSREERMNKVLDRARLAPVCLPYLEEKFAFSCSLFHMQKIEEEKKFFLLSRLGAGDAAAAAVEMQTNYHLEPCTDTFISNFS